MELKVTDITKTFGEKLVLDNISFNATGGRALGLLGRNGAGKTTTIRILMKVFPSDSGKVEFLTDNVEKLKFGYLPEERGLYPKRKISEQLIYLGELKGLTKAEARKNMTALLEKLSMTEYIDKKLETLSKGNQQKIQLAATLINNPDVVILDEPFSGLDPVNAIVLKDLVKELISNGKIVLFSSHQMSYVEEFCQDILIIKQGKIVLNGDLKEIKRSFPRDKIVISTSDADSMINYLKENAVNIVKNINKTEDYLLVDMYSVDQKSELFNILSASKIDIDEFKVYEPSLNDIFVKYTEDVAV